MAEDFRRVTHCGAALTIHLQEPSTWRCSVCDTKVATDRERLVNPHWWEWQAWQRGANVEPAHG